MGMGLIDIGNRSKENSMASLSALGNQEQERKNTNKQLKNQYKQGIASGAAAGATMGAAFGPWGMAAGAVIGGLAASFA